MMEGEKNINVQAKEQKRKYNVKETVGKDYYKGEMNEWVKYKYTWKEVQCKGGSEREAREMGQGGKERNEIGKRRKNRVR